MESQADQRLTRIEEAMAFQEHTIEQLDEQLRRYSGEVERLRREVARLEQRLVDSLEPPAEDDEVEPI